jgi:hypothetical protein
MYVLLPLAHEPLFARLNSVVEPCVDAAHAAFQACRMTKQSHLPCNSWETCKDAVLWMKDCYGVK